MDVGCGGGKIAFEVAGRVWPGGRVVASDISGPILEMAQSTFSGSNNLEFLRCDVESYEFEVRSFDLVISRFGIMFFDNPLKAFGNIRRAMKPDGQLRTLCWKTIHENLWMKIPAWAAFEVLERPSPPGPGDPGPFSLADSQVVETLLEQAGFKNISLTEIKLDLNLGVLDEAVHLMTQLGPVHKPFIEASFADQEKARGLMKAALAEFDSEAGVRLSAACWLIRATP